MKAITLPLLLVNFFLITEPTVAGERKTGPPNLSLVDLMPSDGASYLYYMKCAPKSAGQQVTGQFTARFYLKNNEGKELTLTDITFYFGDGEAKWSKKMMLNHEDAKVKSIKIKKDAVFEWQNKRRYNKEDNSVLFLNRLPTSVTIALTFQGYDEPYKINRQMKVYKNLTGEDGYHFPARESDLGLGEYWSLHGGHGGGGQYYAYDFGIVAWNSKTKSWDNRIPGTDGSKNEHYLAYGKPIVAASDGVVIEFANNVDENEGNKGGGSGGGNYIKINNGKETMCYYHMQKNSLNKNLLSKGAKVKRGDFIGLLGNSGNSGAPHCHIHVIDDPDADGQGPFLPLNFTHIYAVDRNVYKSPKKNDGWVKVDGMGLPFVSNGRMMVWPSNLGPCWYPRGKTEVAKHGISKKNYQAEVQKIWDCGYYPVWVDAYDVKGKTYFNVIFRPKRQNLAIEVRHDLSSGQLESLYKDLVDEKNYRLLQLESYNDDGKLRFAVIFVKRDGVPAPQPAYLAQSAEKHQELFDKYTDMGYVPVNVSVTSVKGKKYYSAFYEKRDVGNCKLRSSLTQQEYQQQFEEMSNKHWDQVYINAYRHKGKTYFSVIWYQNAGFEKYAAVRKASSSGYQSNYNTYAGYGYRTRCVTGYEEGKKHYFAAMWTKD